MSQDKIIKGFSFTNGIQGVAKFTGNKTEDGNYIVENFLLFDLRPNGPAEENGHTLSFATPSYFAANSAEGINTEIPPSAIRFYFELEDNLYQTYCKVTNTIQIVSPAIVTKKK